MADTITNTSNNIANSSNLQGPTSHGASQYAPQHQAGGNSAVNHQHNLSINQNFHMTGPVVVGDRGDRGIVGVSQGLPPSYLAATQLINMNSHHRQESIDHQQYSRGGSTTPKPTTSNPVNQSKGTTAPVAASAPQHHRSQQSQYAPAPTSAVNTTTA